MQVLTTFFFASPIVNISLNFAIWSAWGESPKPHHSMSLQGIATSKIKNFSHICHSVRGHHHQVLKILLLILSQNALVMSLQLPFLRQSVWFPPCPEFRISSDLLLALSPFLYSLSALFLFCCMIPAKLKKKYLKKMWLAIKTVMLCLKQLFNTLKLRHNNW